MTETKQITPTALASITTGIVLVTPFGIIHEAIEWVMGRPIWTHELMDVKDEAAALVLEQFPDMPTDFTGDLNSHVAALRARYGETVAVRKGATERTASPLETLTDKIGHEKVIPVAIDGGDGE